MSKFTFEQQAQYFEKKLNLRTNSYLDILGEEHDYFFVVAGANRNEVLNEFRKAVDEAIHNGETLESFRKRFDEIVAKTGWEYNGGRNWRTRIIYDTNVYGAYNRGRLQQHLELVEDMPYWEYQHNDNAHPRPQHVAWDGLVLRYDDPFWKYHYPIKAYGCHCTVQALDEFDLKHEGKTLSPPPQIEFEQKTVGVRTGNPRVVTVPKGVDVGFTPHNFEDLKAGRNASIDSVLMQKLVSADPKYASLLIDDILTKRPQAVQMLNNSMSAMIDELVKNGFHRNEFRYVGVVPADVISALNQKGIFPQSSIIAVRDTDVWHGKRDNKESNEVTMPLEFWRKLPEMLRKPDAILFQPKSAQQTKDPEDTLLYVYKTEQGKIVVKVDYEVEKRDELTNKKRKHLVNLVRTASVLDEFTGVGRFEVLWGKL